MEQKTSSIPIGQAKLRYAALPEKQRKAVYLALSKLSQVGGRPVTRYDTDLSKATVDTRVLAKLDSMVEGYWKKRSPDPSVMAEVDKFTIGTPTPEQAAREKARPFIGVGPKTTTLTQKGVGPWKEDVSISVPVGTPQDEGMRRLREMAQIATNRGFSDRDKAYGGTTGEYWQDLEDRTMKVVQDLVTWRNTPLEGIANNPYTQAIGFLAGGLASTPASVMESASFITDERYQNFRNPGTGASNKDIAMSFISVATDLNLIDPSMALKGGAKAYKLAAAKLGKNVPEVAGPALRIAKMPDVDIQKAMDEMGVRLKEEGVELGPTVKSAQETVSQGGSTPHGSTIVDEPLLEAPIKGTQASTPTEVPPKPQKPPTEAPRGQETPATGLARRFEDKERLAKGKEPTPPIGTTAKELSERGRALVDSGQVDPQVVRAKIKGGADPSIEDLAVMEYRKRQALDENARWLDQPDSVEKTFAIRKIEDELEDISNIAQKGRTLFQGYGEALQIAHDGMRFVDLKEQGRALNFFKPLGDQDLAELRSIADKYEGALKEIETLKAQVVKSLNKPTAKGSRTVKDIAVSRRRSALNRLRDLGVRTVDVEPVGGIKGKQSGAARAGDTASVADKRSRAVRDLASSYLSEGINDIDVLIKKVIEDVPGMTPDEVLMDLAPQARKYRTDAMVAAIQSRRKMQKIKATAEFRMKSKIEKVGLLAVDFAKNFKRSLQASFDVSAGMLQGKPALMMRPGSWLKSWDEAVRALTAKPTTMVDGKRKWNGVQDMADTLWVELLQDPVIREAHDQGWVSFRGPHGTFTPQEEIFRGNLAHYVPGVARSDAAFGSQLNAMYGDFYRKLASKRPDDAHYKQSVGAIIDMLSGRGHGKIANLLSHEAFGWLGYAPRYAWSLFQLGTGAPLWAKGLSFAARKEAAKAYAGMFATIGLVNLVAHMFGWKVDNDIRSVNYGMVESPEGVKHDAYNKISQAPRLFAQLFYGQIGSRGQYKAPGEYGFDPLIDYVHSNFSPVLRDVEMMATGRIYDPDKREYRDVTPEDWAWSYAPLSIQDMNRLENMSVTTFGSAVLGGRPRAKAEPKKSGDKPAPKFDPIPIGLRRTLGIE